MVTAILFSRVKSLSDIAVLSNFVIIAMLMIYLEASVMQCGFKNIPLLSSIKKWQQPHTS